MKVERLAIGVLLVLWMGLSACTAESSRPQVGSVQRDTLLNVPCCVYLPQDYINRAEKEVFPVLYLQHGMFGNEDDWVAKGNLLRLMDSLLRMEVVDEMVIIMPDNCPGRPSYDEEKNNAMTGEWERNFADFMTEAEHRYSISNLPSKRAIAGLSMGGFHTMHISHHLHGQFGYIGLFSAAIIPTEPNALYDQWEDEVRALMATDPVYWIGIGREDFLYDYVRDYRLWLEANHLEYTYYESEGGHTWPNWQDYLCRFLKKMKFEKTK